MKFLVDAQLPRRLATFLADAGHDAAHTTQLADGNRTTDHDIASLADLEGRVVVTKDRDFWIGHVLENSPQALLVVATGNIANSALLTLFSAHLATVVALLDENPVVELGRDRLVAHADPGSGDSD